MFSEPPLMLYVKAEPVLWEGGRRHEQYQCGQHRGASESAPAPRQDFLRLELSCGNGQLLPSFAKETAARKKRRRARTWALPTTPAIHIHTDMQSPSCSE